MKKFVNLLPEKEKQEVRKEYRTRRRIVSFSLFLIVIVVAIIMLAPSYIASKARLEAGISLLETIETDTEGLDFDTLADHVRMANRDISVISKEIKRSPSYKVIDEVVRNLPNNIKIKSISFTQKTEEKTFQMIVGGIATNRDALVSFSNQIKSMPIFTDAVVPVSSFAQDRDIDFTITIKGENYE